MTIKEIIDRERWELFDKGSRPYITAHNGSLDCIEEAVTKRIEELEGALEDLLTYVTIETPPMVMEIINGVLEEK